MKTTAPIVNVGPNGIGTGSVAYPWDYPDYLHGDMACVAFFRMEIHQVHLACGCQLQNHWAIMLGRWN